MLFYNISLGELPSSGYKILRYSIGTAMYPKYQERMTPQTGEQAPANKDAIIPKKRKIFRLLQTSNLLNSDFFASYSRSSQILASYSSSILTIFFVISSSSGVNFSFNNFFGNLVFCSVSATQTSSMSLSPLLTSGLIEYSRSSAFCWILTNWAYSPSEQFLSSSECVPCSLKIPLSSTRILSAFLMVDSLWAMMMMVMSPWLLRYKSMASWTFLQLFLSSADVASSNKRILGFLRNALAIAIFYF